MPTCIARVLRLCRRASIALALTALTACYEPAPIAHAQLEIDATNAMTLQGKPVQPGELRQSVQALRQSTPQLIVEIRVSPQASPEAIRQAVDSLKSAGARVAFAAAQ